MTPAGGSGRCLRKKEHPKRAETTLLGREQQLGRRRNARRVRFAWLERANPPVTTSSQIEVIAHDDPLALTFLALFDDHVSMNALAQAVQERLFQPPGTRFVFRLSRI